MGAEGSDLTVPDIATLLEMDDAHELNDHYQLICDTNRQWIEVIILRGYAQEQSRIRPKNRDGVCGHHQYCSIPAFISHMIKLNEIQGRCTDEIEENRIATQRHELFDNGICKMCALYITVNMKNVLKDSMILRVKVYCGGDHIDTMKTYYHDVHEHYSGSNNVSLLIPCMQYPQCNKAIFNQSTLWLQFLFQELGAMVFSLNHVLRLLHEGKQKYIECRPDNIDTAFGNLSLCLFQIVRNLSDWKKEHWALILTAKTVEACRLTVFLEFIRLNLEHGFYLNIKEQKGICLMYCFLVFICCTVRQMKKKWFKRYSDEWIKYDITRLQKWCRKLKQMRPRNEGTRNLELSFVYLEQAPFVDNMYEMIRQCIQNVSHQKWMDMQCQRGGCGHRRSCGTLRICSSCKVVRYCSRRCQKRSWNVHKSECLKLKSLRRERSKWIRGTRPLFYPDCNS